MLGGNGSGTLLDAGDGCLLCLLHSPLQRIDQKVVAVLEEAAAVAGEGFEALVIGSEDEHFGTGADLEDIYRLAKAGDLRQIDSRVRRFQGALMGLRDTPVPVVAAPFLYSLGGSTEIVLAADGCQALREIYLGLVEVGVGLVPAGGGCLAMAERWTEGLEHVTSGSDPRGLDPTPYLIQAIEQLALSRVSSGVDEARRLRYLRASAGRSERREDLLPQARHRALGLARSGYRPAARKRLRAAGPDVREALDGHLRDLLATGKIDEHGQRISGEIARVLTGGGAPAGTVLSRQDFLDLERTAFVKLCGDERSLARIENILQGQA